MWRISLFQYFTKVVGSRTVEEIVASIRSSTYRESVLQIRALVEAGDKEEANRLKKQLPSFTVSGIFRGGRKLENLVKYCPLVILDFDGVAIGEIENLVKRAVKEIYTRACFISPSGRGVKVIVEVDSTVDHHQMVFAQVADCYESKLKWKVDRSGQDVTRLCFFSYDLKAYYNAESKQFQLQKVIPQSSTVKYEGHKHQQVFEACVVYTKQKFAYENGNRNNFIYQLAANCNLAGIPLDQVQQFSGVQFDLPRKEMEQTILSAYKRGYDKFATAEKFNLWKAESEKEVSLEKRLEFRSLSQMPSIIFDQLPRLLQSSCATFVDERERDVFLTSALTVLSGCLPEVSGVYDRRVYYPNLYSFIIAPAASGKGVMSFAKTLGMVRHDELLQKSREAMKVYKQEMYRYEVAVFQHKKGRGGEPNPPSNKPPFQLLYIPANSSSAMLIQHLYQNNGSGTLFESEADTLGNVLKQDWGGYSDLLRKAFHHEAISYSRKQGEEFLEINQPKLSVALSGTPNQILKLIPSTEDGLFSRFLFYGFEGEVKWRDVSPTGSGTDWTNLFDQLSREVLAMSNFLKKYPTTVKLSQQQWRNLNIGFTEQLVETYSFVGVEALSIVKRMGLIMFRMAMIFTAMRKFEKGRKEKVITCEEIDSEVAQLLADYYLKHAMHLYEMLPRRKVGMERPMTRNKRQLFEALPSKFKRSEAISIGKQLGWSERSVDRFLKRLSGDRLLQPSHGNYEKV
ncbi:MAG: DUF3987 domain-containing protein [Bacteroidota bacterium]